LCVVRWSSSRRLSSSRSFQWWPAPSLRSSRCPHRSPSIGISCVRPSPFSKLHLREEFGDWGEPTTSGQSSFRLSGAGLPFQPHRRAVLVVSHDLDRFAALVCLIIVPPGAPYRALVRCVSAACLGPCRSPSGRMRHRSGTCRRRSLKHRLAGLFHPAANHGVRRVSGWRLRFTAHLSCFTSSPFPFPRRTVPSKPSISRLVRSPAQPTPRPLALSQE